MNQESCGACVKTVTMSESPDHLEDQGCSVTQHCGYISLTAVTQTLFIFFLYFTWSLFISEPSTSPT